MSDFSDFFSDFSRINNNLITGEFEGRVISASSLTVKAYLPEAGIGDEITLFSPDKQKSIKTEVTGFKKEEVILFPFEDISGVSYKWTAKISGKRQIKISDKMLGHIYDALGNPLDNSSLIKSKSYDIYMPPPPPLKRKRITTRLFTGIKAIDALISIGNGQRMGLFAGSGVGKSTLMGMIAKHSSADINVVCMVGERGREVSEFIEDSLGKDGMQKSIVIVSTSDNTALMRAYAPLTATRIAEYFRDRGKNVLLFVDSITRYARALREITLASGEPPARRGYPPGVFAKLPSLLERAGTSENGSITGIYTVLVEGEDMDEPVADEIRGILDGHIVLSRSLASLRHYPAIDIGESISRIMPKVVTEELLESAKKLSSIIAAYNKNYDFIIAGAYEQGTDPKVDFALKYQNEIKDFLTQGNQYYNWEHTKQQLLQLINNIKNI